MCRIKIIFLLFPFYSLIIAQNLSVDDVIGSIRDNVTCEWREETVDKIIIGSGSNTVTGIATTFMATMEVLQKAVEEGCNLIITHEPTYFNHFDNLDPLINDSVQKKKLDFIRQNQLTIFRFHDHIHMTDPDGITEGVLNKLDWKKYQTMDPSLIELPTITLKALGSDLAEQFETDIIRVIGQPDLKVEKVKLILGAAGSDAHFNAFANEDFDILIVGEAREWETVPYVADAVTMGMKKGLIILGHADSEEPGMDYCAEWLKGFISSVPVKFIPSGNPMWNPGAANK